MQRFAPSVSSYSKKAYPFELFVFGSLTRWNPFKLLKQMSAKNEKKNKKNTKEKKQKKY